MATPPFDRPVYEATIQDNDSVKVTCDGVVNEYASMGAAAQALGDNARALGRPVKLIAIDPHSEQPRTHLVVGVDGGVDVDPDATAAARNKKSRRAASGSRAVTLEDIVPGEAPEDDSTLAEQGTEADQIDGDMPPTEDESTSPAVPHETLPTAEDRAVAAPAEPEPAVRTVEPLAHGEATEPTTPESDDLVAPATEGFAGWCNRTFRTSMPPSAAERHSRDQRTREHDRAVEDRGVRQRIQRPLETHRTIAVVQLKGGGGKTTTAYHLAATYGRIRGGNVLAIEINENQGTLAERSHSVEHERTTLDMIRNLDSLNRRFSDLVRYIRPQGDDRFHVLAAPPEGTDRSRVDGTSVKTAHELLQSLYGIMVMDTGNSAQASTWRAAVDVSDALVFVAHNREDDFDLLQATVKAVREAGYGDRITRSILVTINTATNNQERLRRISDYAAAEGLAGTVVVPFEPSLQEGEEFSYDRLHPETISAYNAAAALLTDQL